jgi:hypothetical protein
MTSPREPPKIEWMARIIGGALIGTPKTATAAEVNRVLAEQIDPHGLNCSYGYYRTVVRRVQEERARLCEFEGKFGSAKLVRPTRRRGLAKGVG